jgi:RNA polymerase subunit RPABC4/transcription elongation factor Spt4
LSNVRAINESLTVPCIHCGATMSSRQNFCPACSYAQPMKRTFTA